MDFGLTMFATDYALDPAVLGRAAEEQGLDALFFPEHTHIPASRTSPWPGAKPPGKGAGEDRPGGSELPKQYWHTYDPFVALATVAAVTERLQIGTGICLLVERDPITTAKAVASLDALSGGRMLFGIGGGWNREEMANHGTDPSTRFDLLRERVEACKAIWTQDEPEYHGKYVDFDPLWSWPKPVQRPHPPVLVGGGGPTVLRRVVDYGDEWAPNRMSDLDELRERIAQLRELAAEQGRNGIGISLFGGRPDAGDIQRCAEMGVTRYVFGLPSAGADEVLPRVERYGRLAAEFRG